MTDSMTHSTPFQTTDLDHVIETAISRRGILGVMTFGLGTFVMGTTSLTSLAFAGTDRFGFNQISADTHDSVTVPEGFEWYTLIRWGDPLWSDVPEFDDATLGTAASQARAFGDNNDGMAVFHSAHGTVMAVNNEYTNRRTCGANQLI